MFKMKQHLQNHNGDANVSKMTLIAIVFVVGAILLVLVTSAFRNPINRWFSTVTSDWFAKENGEFNLMLDPYANYERHTNGTIKGVKYVSLYDETGGLLLTSPEMLIKDAAGRQQWYWISCDANGNRTDFGTDWEGYGQVQISNDGSTITVDGMVFKAMVPNP